MYAAHRSIDSWVMVSELALDHGRRPLANGPSAPGPAPAAPRRPMTAFEIAVMGCASDDFASSAADPDEELR